MTKRRRSSKKKVTLTLTERQWELVSEQLCGADLDWHPSTKRAFEHAELEICQAAGGIV